MNNKTVRSTISLLNSMIASGEDHTPLSKQAVKDALKELDEERIGIFHSNLVRMGNSATKSECPFCSGGILPMTRDNMSKLLVDDRCLGCGRLVRYLDVKENCIALEYTHE